MNRQAWLRAWPLGLLVLIGLVLWADQSGFWRAPDASRNPQARHLRADCATPASGCSLQVDGREIRFGMQGELKPLAPFQIWLEIPGAQVTKAEARFTMEGMDMGFNLYRLRPDARGILRATVTLPICVTGRRDWNMILEVEQPGEHLRISVPFVTNL